MTAPLDLKKEIRRDMFREGKELIWAQTEEEFERHLKTLKELRMKYKGCDKK